MHPSRAAGPARGRSLRAEAVSHHQRPGRELRRLHVVCDLAARRARATRRLAAQTRDRFALRARRDADRAATRDAARAAVRTADALRARAAAASCSEPRSGSSSYRAPARCSRRSLDRRGAPQSAARAIALTVAYAVGRRDPDARDRARRPAARSGSRTQAPRLRLASGIAIGLVALAIALQPRHQLPDHTPRLHPGAAEPDRGVVHGEARARFASRRQEVDHQTTTTTTTPIAQPGPGASSLPVLRRTADHRRRPVVQLAPAHARELRGKVVLLDFWTYSCINCLRTLPHLEAWYAPTTPTGCRSSASTAPSSPSNTSPRTSPPRSSASGSPTPSSRTTTSPPGTTTPTSTGRPTT